MAFKKFGSGDSEGGFQRQIHDVSSLQIKCCDCGADITQLPFQPDPSRLNTIRCQDCMRKWRSNRPRRF